MEMHEINKANFPMDPKHTCNIVSKREKGHTSKVSRKQNNQESVPKYKSKQGITIKPRMVETSQGCKVYSNSQVFRFVFILKSTS